MTTKLSQLEAAAVDLVSRLAPWIAPLPTAYLVGRATVNHLAWPLAVAVMAALTVETLGLASTSTAFDLREYNASKRKTDPPAPFAFAAALVALYFAIATGLTVALDIAPDLAVYAPAIFPALSLTGVTLLALRSDHRRRLEAIALEKAERKAERQAAKAVKAMSSDVKTVKLDMSTDMQNVKAADLDMSSAKRAKLDALLDMCADDPALTVAEAAKLLQVSRQSVYGYVEILTNGGKLRRNGHGWEVTQ